VGPVISFSSDPFTILTVVFLFYYYSYRKVRTDRTSTGMKLHQIFM